MRHPLQTGLQLTCPLLNATIPHYDHCLSQTGFDATTPPVSQSQVAGLSLQASECELLYLIETRFLMYLSCLVIHSAIPG